MIVTRQYLSWLSSSFWAGWEFWFTALCFIFHLKTWLQLTGIFPDLLVVCRGALFIPITQLHHTANRHVATPADTDVVFCSWKNPPHTIICNSMVIICNYLSVFVSKLHCIQGRYWKNAGHLCHKKSTQEWCKVNCSSPSQNRGLWSNAWSMEHPPERITTTTISCLNMMPFNLCCLDSLTCVQSPSLSVHGLASDQDLAAVPQILAQCSLWSRLPHFLPATHREVWRESKYDMRSH